MGQAVFTLDRILYPGKEKTSCHPGLGWKQNHKGNFFFFGDVHEGNINNTSEL